jgi:hypothetical protein
LNRGASDTKPKGGEFGNCTRSSHYWREF